MPCLRCCRHSIAVRVSGGCPPAPLGLRQRRPGALANPGNLVAVARTPFEALRRRDLPALTCSRPPGRGRRPGWQELLPQPVLVDHGLEPGFGVLASCLTRAGAIVFGSGLLHGVAVAVNGVANGRGLLLLS